jgi:hypothetical protein
MNMHDLVTATSGAIMIGYLIIGAIFWRCWSKTRERLFARFAVAFYVLTLERVLLLVIGENQPGHIAIYITRLAAFLIIIWSIWNQSRSRE